REELLHFRGAVIVNLDEVFMLHSGRHGNGSGGQAPSPVARISFGNPMSYQVPMSEVAVTVAITGSEPEEHFVYLHPHSEYREGPETMSDYLNSPRRFFPMVLGGAPRMINRDQIMWVRYEKLPDITDPEVTMIEKLTILELTDC